MRGSTHVEWIYLYSRQISRILEANIDLNYSFFISKCCAHFSGVILIDSHRISMLLLFGSCFHNKISEKLTFCCQDLVNNCHYVTVKILRYKDTLDRKSIIQTLGSSYLIYLCVIAFILWIKMRLSCIK